MVNYFRNLELKYGIMIGRKFEDGSIHSLPQDYADMLGWEELTSIAKITDTQVQLLLSEKNLVKYQILMPGNMGLLFICVSIQRQVLMNSGPNG